jgi:hypothetical protein
MDENVLRAMARWPAVPAVYGWLALDRRGNWLLKEPGNGRSGRIGKAALRDFIARNYSADARGCWFFQNGPQRVYVKLAYTPFVMHYEGDALLDHCGRPVRIVESYLDDEGSVLVLGRSTGWGRWTTAMWGAMQPQRSGCRALRARRSRPGSASCPTPRIPCADSTSSL